MPETSQSTISINSIGFLPDRPKKASVAGAMKGAAFRILRIGDDSVILTGRLSGPVRNVDTDEELLIADFSELREPGQYVLDIPGVGRSGAFRIGSDIYNVPFYTVARGMYLWRCGTGVRGEFNGQVYATEACHTDDAWLDAVGGGHVRHPSTGGWHDAGDYNKYVVNAGITVGNLLQAWEHFSDKLGSFRLDLPESGNGAPDLLNEVRWEMDWLLTMQADDGRVWHKLTARRFCPFVMPQDETEPRFMTDWSSAATADFVAMTAMAARIYKPFDPSFAARCLNAARKSHQFLLAHPQEHQPDLEGFRTGGYTTSDPDDRLWAVAELWETTGEPAYLEEFESRAGALDPKIDENWDWQEVKNLGMITYVFSRREGRDPKLVEQITRDLIWVADTIVRKSQSHGYGRGLDKYYWGCNGGVVRQVVNLQAAHRVKPDPAYLDAALDAIGHVFGRNWYGRSFVTGLGHRPPMHPHDRRSGADGIVDPWPGYLVGGGHPTAKDWHDEEPDARTNEIAINWNSALIYALAGFVDPTQPTLSGRI